MNTPLLRRPATWVAIGVIVVIGGAFGLFWFQPWKIFTDKEVNDTLPAVAARDPAGGDGSDADGPDAPPAADNRLIARGTLVTQEHETSGAVEIVELADGRRQLVLRDLRTSDGPDLRIWLTDQRVVEGPSGWRVFDDGAYTEIGKLKGNQGNQVYDIPSGVDLSQYTSMTIWCKRFAISFGAATLEQA